MSQTGVDEVIDAFQSAWSSKDPAAFAACCASDLHYEDPMTVEPLDGPSALGAHAARLWQAFPDARMERLGERLSDGRFVAAPVRLLATHRGLVEEFPPTGRFVIVQGVFYCEIVTRAADGDGPPRPELWRVRAFFDLYGVAIQLGVLPRPGSVGERAMLLLRGFGLRSR